MGTKTTISIIAVLSIVLAALTFKNLKRKSEANFQVITWKKYNICFLVHPQYKVIKTDNAFKYVGGKNSGIFTLISGELNENAKRTQIGDFSGSYDKKVDLRIFEYEVAPGIILKDTFDFAKKTPANLLPVRNNCSKYLERYPIMMEI